jgi:molybdenum-dependent DNA-binding transcriptional regulator ModE
MKRRKGPLESMDVKDEEAKGKVSLVLEVLSGEKSIAQACKETGLKPLSYYKLEERMVGAMLDAAKMPVLRGRRKSPMAEATSLSQQTEELRQEHRRIKSLVRITKRLFRQRTRKMRKNGPGRPKGPILTSPPAEPEAAAPRRPGRPPATEKVQA